VGGGAVKKATVRQEPLWRDEFAIDTVTDAYVSRRQFSKFLILTSLGMFAGQLWILVRNWFVRSPSFNAQVIGGIEDTPVGGVRLFSYPTPDDPCIMVRTSPVEFVAYSQKCTHLSCAVYYETETGRLECPCHEGYFSVEDGSVLQGPPTRGLPRIVLAREGDLIVATGVEL
jgi:nitrite reductase/ring-hydroxylating ferredoxin subunit